MKTAPATVSGVTISNPDKVWWPDEGITKVDVVRYYDAVWPLIRPWLRDRPLTAERCPDGMGGSCLAPFHRGSVELDAFTRAARVGPLNRCSSGSQPCIRRPQIKTAERGLRY